MNTPRFETLDQWLAWQEQLHPRSIDLGLERIQRVLRRLHPEPPSFAVITVGGTNGKGSCVAFLEAMLRAGGYRVGAYTSPHLLQYNERIRVSGATVSDVTLCRTFARIDAVREDISLTFFEFATLAAFEIFREANVSVALLEVGLGGRLDAVNVLDADAALVTSIGIDHVEWLGSDRESIGGEKAGIYRSGRPAICGDPNPPRSLLEHVRAIGAKLYISGQDYGFQRRAGGWCWWNGTQSLDALPLPVLAGEHQLSNAASAVMALTTLAERLPVQVDAVRKGIAKAQIAARFEIVPGPIEWILDVAHNPQGAAALARCLAERYCTGHTRAVVSMLNGKDVAGVARAMDGVVDQWYAATSPGPRGLAGETLASALKRADIGGAIPCYSSVSEALQDAYQDSERGDRIVVFGSFHTAVEGLRLVRGKVEGSTAWIND